MGTVVYDKLNVTRQCDAADKNAGDLQTETG